MNAERTLIEWLAGSDTYRHYETAYSAATGMPVALRAVTTWQLPLHGKPKENPFCAIMAEKSRTCAACLQMQEKLTRDAHDGPCAIPCAFGLYEIAVPVKLGTRTIGILQTGQVLRQPPTPGSYAATVAGAGKFGPDLTDDRTREAYFKTPVVSAEKIDSVISLLTIFADHLSMKSNQIALQNAQAEPPVIARAKAYIQAHYMEQLALGQVAAAVNTSIFYFCKLFKKVAGINFTEYVSRVRIEKAKNLLLNPNLRVTEIAYEVGFQSLTHFNRVFKKITGESPTEYREHLPNPQPPAAT